MDLVNLHGAPPQIIWLTCGNTSNARLQTILKKAMPRAIELLMAGENIAEISGAGYGIHWEDLDEDLGVEGLLMRKKSSESAGSFARWLSRRNRVSGNEND